MNFFQNIALLGTNVQWALSIAVSDKGEITGCIYPQAKDIKDKALQKLRPVNFGGTPAQLDEQFFIDLQVPIAPTMALIRNLREVQEGQKNAEKAAKISANKVAVASHNASKQSSNKPQADQSAAKPSPAAAKAPPKDAQDKGFETAIAAVKKLEEQGKIGQALGKMPKVADFPRYGEQIAQYTKELRLKRPDLLLFDQPEEPAAEPADTLTPSHPGTPDTSPADNKTAEVAEAQPQEEIEEEALEENDEDNEGDDEDAA